MENLKYDKLDELQSQYNLLNTSSAPISITPLEIYAEDHPTCIQSLGLPIAHHEFSEVVRSFLIDATISKQ
jgi:hypothetical protein